MTRLLLTVVVILPCCLLLGDGPEDNLPDKVRRIPPPGIAVAPADRNELDAGIVALEKEIEQLRSALKAKPQLLDLLPDVQIYHTAVSYALKYDEFFNPREIAVARTLLKQGMERARALHEGKAPWTTATGLVVRGYRSKIDGSAQPYGLVVPASYQPGSPYQHRLDVWCHGRGETLSELNFIDGRQKSAGEFTPLHAFVLHPYGRYCNANKFAGEIDLFEALTHARKNYPIDDNRIVMRGFSMGGAACWQFAVHHPDQWVAAAPGAGFSETADFLKVFQSEALTPTWYEQKLWHWYDCTDYAVNLFNCPTVAYSGEIDKQKQAADMMAKALAAEGMTLTHIIGPQTAHRYHPEAKEEINRRIDAIAARGRDACPPHIKFTTFTLRYNQAFWVTVDALEQHWERARVEAEVAAPDTVKVTTANVAALTLDMPSGACRLDATRPVKLLIDGQSLTPPPVQSDRSWSARLKKSDKGWSVVSAPEGGTLRKRHGLQGPIDDAFLDSFIMVRPTGQPLTEKIGAWTAAEMKHAIEHWRRQFRGDAPVKDDTAITQTDIADNNLILWGDPSSNKFFAKIAEQLPIRWTAERILAGARDFPGDTHVPVFIFPNPLNRQRYVVVNSGFTYREYDYLNNARQVPKLPDYAIVDISTPVTSRLPGSIVDAGFFGEKWEWKEGR